MMWLGVDWTAVGAIVGSIYTLSFIVSVFVLVGQLKATRAAMYSQTFAVAAGMVNSPEVVRAREMVWKQRDQPAVNRFHGNVADGRGQVIVSRREYAALVCRTFDDVGIMAHDRMIPEDTVVGSWGRDLLLQWEALVEFVQRERETTGNTHLWKEFEHLAQRARQALSG